MDETAPIPRPTLRGLLANPGYRRLWAARTVSQWGDVAQFTTLGLLLFSLTGSGLGVSGAVIAEIVPVLLLAPVAGALVDRLPRVRVMVLADLARVGLAGTLALWHEDAAVAYLVAAGLSAGAVFFNPAASSVLPSLVNEDELVAANSGIWTAAVTSQVVLAPVAGLLAATVGFGPAFAANAGSFGVSALLLRGLVVPGTPGRVHATSVVAQAREGISALVSSPLLRALGAAQLLAALSAGATSALLVVLARRSLGTDGAGFGVLLGAIAVGALAGPWFLTRFVRNSLRPVFVFGPFALRGVVDLVLAVVTTVPAAALALVTYGIGTSTGSITFTSLIQTRVPGELRGRAFAGFDFLWQLGRLVSLLAGGLLADRFGIQVVYVLGGLLLLAAGACGRALTRGQGSAWAGPWP
ncbi:MAG: MFS transporter [Sporichthyaceae bacterium]|nr:MFS transporter [Sporichthyaceae bacterium]